MDRRGDLDRTTFNLMASLQRLTARLFSGQREAGEVPSIHFEAKHGEGKKTTGRI